MLAPDLNVTGVNSGKSGTLIMTNFASGWAAIGALAASGRWLVAMLRVVKLKLDWKYLHEIPISIFNWRGVRCRLGFANVSLGAELGPDGPAMLGMGLVRCCCAAGSNNTWQSTGDHQAPTSSDAFAAPLPAALGSSCEFQLPFSCFTQLQAFCVHSIVRPKVQAVTETKSVTESFSKLSCVCVYVCESVWECVWACLAAGRGPFVCGQVAAPEVMWKELKTITVIMKCALRAWWTQGRVYLLPFQLLQPRRLRRFMAGKMGVAASDSKRTALFASIRNLHKYTHTHTHTHSE